jgi:hypothetical protein
MKGNMESWSIGLLGLNGHSISSLSGSCQIKRAVERNRADEPFSAAFWELTPWSKKAGL